jgi:hypothetical protein
MWISVPGARPILFDVFLERNIVDLPGFYCAGVFYVFIISNYQNALLKKANGFYCPDADENRGPPGCLIISPGS